MKKLISAVLSAMLIASSIGSTAMAEEEYVEVFKSSDSFSVTDFRGPWYYYSQQASNNSLSRLLGFNNLTFGTSITGGVIDNAEVMQVRRGQPTVDSTNSGGAMPSGASESDAYNFGYVGAKVMGPEERWNWSAANGSIQTMKAFEAPYDCDVTVTADTGKIIGMVSRANKAYGDRRVRIMKNNPSNAAENVAANKVWPTDSEWVQIDGIGSIDFEAIDLTLEKGDMLFFIVDNNNTRFNDDIYWDPVISVKEKRELATLINNNFDNNTAPVEMSKNAQSFTFADGVAKATGTYCKLFYGGDSWSEYEISADITAHNSGFVSWEYRMQDANGNSEYNLLITPAGALNVRKKTNNASSTVAVGNFSNNAFPYGGNAVPAEFKSGFSLPYNLRVYVKENRVRVYINDVMVASYTDSANSYPTGPVAIGSSGSGSGVCIDNVKISAKRVAPSVSDITLTQEDGTEIGSMEGVSSLTATAKIINNYNDPSRYMMIIALYDKDGKFIAMKSGISNGTKKAGAVWTASLGSEYMATLTYDISGIENVSYAKAYLWNDLNNIKPQQASVKKPQ